MPSVNPYLNFPGNTEEAFNFYKAVFGGEFVMLQHFKDMPGCGGLSPEDQNKLGIQWMVNYDAKYQPS